MKRFWMSEIGCYIKRDTYRNKTSQAANILAWDVHKVMNGSAYGIRTRDLRLERAMSWTTRRMRLVRTWAYHNPLQHGLSIVVFSRDRHQAGGDALAEATLRYCRIECISI
jgi:hypothetical protein